MIDLIAANLMGAGVPPILALYLATKLAAGGAGDFADLTGDIAIAQMAGGVGATPATYWRGDGSWAALPVSLTETNHATGFTLAATDSGNRLVATAAITIALPAIGTLGDGFECEIVNDSGGSVILDGLGAVNVTLSDGDVASVLECRGKQRIAKGASTIVS